jgi:hypothetical protein
MRPALQSTAALVLALLCPAMLCLAAMAAPDSDAAERARIAAERRAVEARFDAARRDCQARFVVNECLDRARQARRAALEPLQRQTHLLDDARRRERAVERLRGIQERESAAAAKPALAPPLPASGAAAAARPALQRAVRPAPSASVAALAAQQRQAQHQQRLQQAKAHQDAVQARNARRDAQRKPAAPLPVPVPGAPSP